MRIPRDDDAVRWIMPLDDDAAMMPRDENTTQWTIPRDV
jgi:hypothetical protein